MFEVAYKRTGDIQSVRINNQTSVGVGVAPGSTMRQIYKAKWLIEKEAKFAAEFEREHAAERLLSGTTKPE